MPDVQPESRVPVSAVTAWRSRRSRSIGEVTSGLGTRLDSNSTDGAAGPVRGRSVLALPSSPRSTPASILAGPPPAILGRLRSGRERAAGRVRQTRRAQLEAR